MGWHEWLACALFYRNYVDGHVATNQFWSLAVEEHFYLLWPPVLVLFGLKRARWIAVLIAVSAALWRGWLLQTAGTALEWAHTGVRIDSLVCGCLVALLAGSVNQRRWSGGRYGAAVWTVAVLVFVLMTGSASYASSAALLKACLVPLIIFGTVRNPDWLPSRLLELRPLRWIGQISYSLYLWNIVIISPPVAGMVYGWPEIVERVLLTVLVSWCSYRFIEKPMIRLGHRLAPPASAGRSDLAPQPIASLGQAAQAPL
jgi:peptidoglycan/LPS O-acetylase OafA/YrhL